MFIRFYRFNFGIDEPGEYDPKKYVLPHHIRRGTKTPRVEKHNYRRENNTNVISMVGLTAELKCDVGINNATVIWVKHKNKPSDDQYTVLTINSSTIVDDQRFLSTVDTDLKIWVLRIRYANSEDMGWYECQVCNRPTFSIYVQLQLTRASAVILGKSVREVDRGFPIRLSCILNTTTPPMYMFWYHDNRMINYDLKDGAIVREGRMGTELIFPRALPAHTGNYSCVPSNARQASVRVIVHHQGEQLPASVAYHSPGPEGPRGSTPITAFMLIIIIIINYWYVRTVLFPCIDEWRNDPILHEDIRQRLDYLRHSLSESEDDD